MACLRVTGHGVAVGHVSEACVRPATTALVMLGLLLAALVLVTVVFAATITGTKGNDTIRGTARADVINGGAGNDRIYGLGGNDRLNGGAGNDIINGGTGKDSVSCGTGIDRVQADHSDEVAKDCEIVTRQKTTTTSGKGNAKAGKAVFTSAGCLRCHVLADYRATKPTYDLVVTRVTNGYGEMPSFKRALNKQQIQDVAAYVSSVGR